MPLNIIRSYSVFYRLCLVFLAVQLASCSVYDWGRDPKVSVAAPEGYSLDTGDGVAGYQGPWWETFKRPALDKMVLESLEKNYDVAAAVAVMKQAQAVVTRTASDRYPMIDLEGNYNKDWEGSDEQRASGDIGAALSWEADLWGRIGNAAEADRFEAIARAEDLYALRLSLSAEVAEAYFGAVAQHQRLSLLQEQLKLDRDLLNILDLRLENGVGTRVDVLQQSARVADSETLIPRAQSDLAVFENRLDVLLGQAPDGRTRVSAEDDLSFMAQLPEIGVPAGLLLNRPDLRAAQAELVAADADIAAAIADRYPRIMLDASYVYTDGAAYSGPVAAIMGMFIQPLLDWGQRKAEVDRNKALYEEKLAAFTQLFLEAVEDVENALIQERKQREFLERLESQRDILQKTVSSSEKRYTQGIDDYTPVINALQELRIVERSLISERLALINIRIALFRALGGPMARPVQQEESEE